MKPRIHRNGFTLIELMICVFLLLIVAGVIGLSAWFASRPIPAASLTKTAIIHTDFVVESKFVANGYYYVSDTTGRTFYIGSETSLGKSGETAAVYGALKVGKHYSAVISKVNSNANLMASEINEINDATIKAEKP